MKNKPDVRKMIENLKAGRPAQEISGHRTMLEKWDDFLTETEAYNQVLYKATFGLVIYKDRDADITQTLSEIRSIPMVTTVFRTEEGEEDKAHIRSVYDIKFILKRQDPPNIYLKNTLMLALKKIPSVEITSFQGLERVRG